MVCVHACLLLVLCVCCGIRKVSLSMSHSRLDWGLNGGVKLQLTLWLEGKGEVA